MNRQRQKNAETRRQSERDTARQLAALIRESCEKQFRFAAFDGGKAEKEQIFATLTELQETPFYVKRGSALSSEELCEAVSYLRSVCGRMLEDRNCTVWNLSSDDLNRYFLSALLAMQAGRYADALRDLLIYESYGDKFFRGAPYLTYYKGVAAYGTGDFALARMCFETYLRADAEDEIAWFRLGNACFRLADWGGALAAYEKALFLRSGFFEVQVNIALTARRLGDKAAARAMARKEAVYRAVFAVGTLLENPLTDALAIPPDFAAEDVPVFINSYNRLGTLKALVEWFVRRGGTKRVYILDNDSSYPPLLDYYRSLDEEAGRVQVLRLRKNLGHKALWTSRVLEILRVTTPYLYTDSDILPDENCPPNVVGDLLEILRRYPFLKKVGLGLRTDDITYFNAAATKEAEKRFYLHPMEEELYFGAVDTTFALYRNYRHYNLYVSARTTGCRMARHMPWYYDYDNLPEDERYYVEHANESASLVRALKARGIIT